MKKHSFLSALFGTAICILTTTGLALAQPGSGGPTPGGPTATAIPLDGGASLLLAAGAAYGIKKLRDRKGLKRAR